MELALQAIPPTGTGIKGLALASSAKNRAPLAYKELAPTTAGSEATGNGTGTDPFIMGVITPTSSPSVLKGITLHWSWYTTGIGAGTQPLITRVTLPIAPTVLPFTCKHLTLHWSWDSKRMG